MMCRSLLFLRPTPALIAADKPNVLFIMALDLRPELASYGPPALTPNLQRLARRGGQFTFAYLACPATIPRARASETGQKRIHHSDAEKPELKGRRAVPFSEKRRLLLQKKWPVSEFSCTVADDLAWQLSCNGASYPPLP